MLQKIKIKNNWHTEVSTILSVALSLNTYSLDPRQCFDPIVDFESE